MNKTMLKQYVYLVREIEQIEEEKEKLASGLICAVHIDGMPHGNSAWNDRMAELTVKLMDLTSVLAERLNSVIALRIEIENSIDSLEPQERIVLRLRYIEGKDWEKIALSLNYSIQHVWRLHSEILQKLDGMDSGVNRQNEGSKDSRDKGNGADRTDKVNSKPLHI